MRLSDLEKYKNIRNTKREACAVCGNRNTTPLIELPQLPLTEVFTVQPGSPAFGLSDQSFHFCRHCGHGQLESIVDQNLLYRHKSGYEFRTSQSYTGQKTTEFFLSFLNKVSYKKTFKCALEVGCNDGHLLKQIKPIAEECVGVDPILKGQEQALEKDGIKAIGSFFEECSLSINPDLVICKDVIEHVTDPRQLISELVKKSSDDALFLIQVPMLDNLVANLNFDQIFHQHLNYFSLSSFNALIESLGCCLIGYTVNEMHWNSAIFAFSKKSVSKQIEPKNSLSPEHISAHYQVFQSQMAACELALENSARTAPVLGYGAALMLPVIKYHFPNQLSVVEAIFDDNKARHGQYYLNASTPIIATDTIEDFSNFNVLLTAFSSRLNAQRMLKKLAGDLKPRQVYYPFHLVDGVI